MRILANYGVKTNGDSHTVTFETTGDVPAEKAPATADELFRLAKEAVQRQVEGNGQPAQEHSEIPERVPSNGSSSGNGHSAPATARQVGLIRKLAHEVGADIPSPEALTKAQASSQIKALMAAKF